jgi:ferric-dicitrate binding protein FerR (iron transport regulator)
MKNISDYQHFEFEDLIEDQQFRNWILYPTPDRNAFWEQFITAYPDKTEAVTEARAFLLGTREHFDERGISEQAVESRLQQLLEKSAAQTAKRNEKHNIRRLSRRWALAAAIAMVLGLLSWLWLSQSQPNMQVIATNFGEWKTVTLPDGSGVQLNADSEIKFADDWQTGKDREVWLSGEAFFEVTKDARGAKFTVYTEDLSVEVLGTAFNVHSRGKQTEVFLEEGKVRLDMGREEKVLAPGDFLAYSSKQKQITEFKQTSNEQHASWKDGSLILIDKPVSEILNKVEEIFGYEVVVNNPELLNEQRTIGIPMDVFEMALPILEKTLNAKITVREDRLIVQ